MMTKRKKGNIFTKKERKIKKERLISSIMTMREREREKDNSVFCINKSKCANICVYM
jgi:hypothetical protein